MTDILDEILHDQRDAKKLYYFKKALPFIVIVTILVAIGMFIYQWNQEKKVKHDMQMGDILIKSIAQIETDKDLSIQSLDSLVNNTESRVGELAALEQVGIKIATNDFNNAKVLLGKIINNKNYYEVTTAYARIVWLSLVIDERDLSDETKNQVQEYLKYFSNENQPFFGVASILKALWYIKSNQKELAIDILKRTLALENASQVIKEQAKSLLSNINK